ncbi:MAG: hypothetical protein Q4B26_20025 [Eubacteriales bacterium]|nr:hypothetical protein [Eubacteriales bacterium]
MSRRSIAIDEKIRRQEERITKTREKLDAEMDVLKELLDQKEALRRERFLQALIDSDRTDEEIMAFLGGPKSKENSTAESD